MTAAGWATLFPTFLIKRYKMNIEGRASWTPSTQLGY